MTGLWDTDPIQVNGLCVDKLDELKLLAPDMVITSATPPFTDFDAERFTFVAMFNIPTKDKEGFFAAAKVHEFLWKNAISWQGGRQPDNPDLVAA